MAQLAFEAALVDVRPGVVVERGGVERVGDTVDDRRAEPVAVRGQQPAGRLNEGVHRGALVAGGVA